MHRFAQIIAFVALLPCASVAHAGPYTDDLSKCLVRSTTSDDRIVLMQWIFSAMALHPAVSALASITAEQRGEFDKHVAGLFVRLMAVNCRQQTIDAVKYEGGLALQTSFGLLGQVAMRGLMGDAHVAAGFKMLSAYFKHDERWLALMHDAGLPSPAK